MSTHFMSYVLRLCDRLFDKDSPDAIDRQGQLNQMLTVVLIFHLIMGTSFLKMQEYEKKHPRIIRDVNISFEFSTPPPVAEFRVGEINAVPKAIQLTEGKSQNVGSADSQKARVEKTTIETPKAEEKEQPLTAEPVPAKLSHAIAEAPLSITSMSPIKADPIQQSRSQKYNKEAELTGTSLNLTASGAAKAGGEASDENGNGGKGGKGINGGAGTDQGNQGTGTGDDFIGIDEMEKIDTTVPKVATGDISRYKRALAKLLQDSWHPGRKGVSLTVNLLISKDGRILSSELVSSSGSKRIDRDAMEMIEQLEVKPLPDWFKGHDLLFQFDLNSIWFALELTCFHILSVGS